MFSDLTLLFLVWSIPGAIEVLFPQDPNAILVGALLVPTLAFILRVFAGRRQISENHCSRQVRRFQFAVFLLGIFLLLLVDCLLFSLHGIGGNMLLNAILYMVLSPLYLLPMTIAMYPGRAPAFSDDIETEFYPDA